MKFLAARAVAIARQQLRRPPRRLGLLLRGAALVGLLCILELLLHAYTIRVPRPPEDLDAPFATQCQDPAAAAASQPREKAALVMLARNSELREARETIRQIERQFNRWFHYPVVFLNNEPWDPEFVRVLNESVSGEATFDVVAPGDWTYPEWVDEEEARRAIAQQGRDGVWKGGLESYHHMCRFYSG